MTTASATPAPSSQPIERLACTGAVGVSAGCPGPTYPARAGTVGTGGTAGACVGAAVKKKLSWPGVVTPSRSTPWSGVLTCVRIGWVRRFSGGAGDDDVAE